MKTHPLNHAWIWIPALIAVALSTTGQSQTLDSWGWGTVDDFQAVPGITSSFGRGMGTRTDPATGTSIFSVGSATLTDGTTYAVINRSLDGGATWDTVQQFALPGSTSADFEGIASSAATGQIYVGGRTYSSTLSHWIVQESDDGGDTWSSSDDFTNSGLGAVCYGVGVDPKSGNAFAVGDQLTGPNKPSVWTVRRKAAGQTTWTTIDAAAGTTGQSLPAFATAIAFHPTAGIFVVGQLWNKYGIIWTIRRSTDGGATWATVDSYQPAPYYSGASGIAIDGSGAIYVAGRAAFTKNSSLLNWVVRKSVQGGASGSWQTIDNFRYSQPNSSMAHAIAIDPVTGTVYVAGSGGSTKSSYDTWVIRKLVAGSSSFEEGDEFPASSGGTTTAYGITADRLGNIYATGFLSAAYPPATEFWVTRKLAANP
jgi:hypothetical protein